MTNHSTDYQLHLASASPRRYDLLTSMGLKVNVCPANIDETPQQNETPEKYVQRLAREKARAALKKIGQSDKPFLAADTVVVCQGSLFGKPTDETHAIKMWQAMSGRYHQVLTAICLTDGKKTYTKLSSNDVLFHEISDQAMSQYWQTGEPQDKAGAYAIQGYAAAWVKSVKGSPSGIIGLPLYETNQMLRAFDLQWL